MFHSHSYRNASTGFNLDARYAGIAPAIIPIDIENNNAKRIISGVTIEFEKRELIPLGPPAAPLAEIPDDDPIINEKITPRIIPPHPPTNPIRAAFKMKIINMSLFLAPIAFIIPISFVFSSTEVNIVFAIPTAPASKDIAAIATRNKEIVFRVEGIVA